MGTITITSKTYRTRSETVLACPKCSLNMVIDNLYNKKGDTHHGIIGYCVNGCVHDDQSPFYLFLHDEDELKKTVEKMRFDYKELSL